MSGTDYNDTLERFIASSDFNDYVSRASAEAANGRASWVELHEDGTWTFRGQQDTGVRSKDVPLHIYWTDNPDALKKNLRDELKKWIDHPL